MLRELRARMASRRRSVTRFDQTVGRCHAGVMKRRLLLCAVVGWGLACAGVGAAQEKGIWRAVSTTAKSITGDVTFSNEKIAINYSSGYPIAQIRILQPSEITAAFDLDGSPEGSGSLYRLSIPGATRFQHKNTLCGGDDTQWMVTYVSGRSLQVAFFSGQKMPVLTGEAIATSTNLCGTFTYGK